MHSYHSQLVPLHSLVPRLSVQLFFARNKISGFVTCEKMLDREPGNEATATGKVVTIFLVRALFIRRTPHDVLAEHSAVEPSILQPAEKLEWNISPESARDIDTAKRNFDRYMERASLISRHVAFEVIT